MNVVTNMQDLTDEDLADTSRALMAELDHRRAVAALHRQVEDDIRAYQMVAGITSTRGKRPDGTWPDWVQPTGAHDAYNTGDRVMFNGDVWESTTDANVWAPDVYPDGWRKVEQ